MMFNHGLASWVIFSPGRAVWQEIYSKIKGFLISAVLKYWL